MNINKRALLAIAATLAAFLAVPAYATPVIGQAVQGVGDPTPTGNQDSDGDVRFFIPLNGSEVYGDTSGGGTGGLTSDTCSFSSSTEPCSGGSLDMFLFFDMPGAGATTVQIDFIDLDIEGDYAPDMLVNDPWYFIETIEIIDPDGNTLTFGIDDLLAGSDNNGQSISFDLDIDGPFYLHLTFTTAFSDLINRGSFRNTSEYLNARASTSVPEPGTLALLGSGLLLLGFSRRRRPTRHI